MSFAENQMVRLSQDYKDNKAGSVFQVKTVRAVGAKTIAQVTDPSGAIQGVLGIPCDKLEPADGGGVPAVADAGPEFEGPTTDFFVARTDQNDEMVINFLGAYLDANGQDNLTDLLESMNRLGVPQDQVWTREQTARLSLDFSDMCGLDRDPLAAAALQPIAAVVPAVVAPPAPAPVAAPVVAAPVPIPVAVTPAPAPVAVAPPIPAPVVAAPIPVAAPPQLSVVPPLAVTPAPAAVEAAPATSGRGRKKAGVAAPDVAKVDKDGWDAVHMDALRILGALAPLFAEFPDTFNESLTKAASMLNAADKVK